MIVLEKLKERRSLGRNRIDGQVILKRIFKFEWEEVKWIGLSQDGDSGFAFVDMLMSIWFHKMGRELFDYWKSKLYVFSALDYSVDKYIYRSCLSGTSNVTLL